MDFLGIFLGVVLGAVLCFPCGTGEHIAEIVDAYERRREGLRAEREAAND